MAKYLLSLFSIWTISLVPAFCTLYFDPKTCGPGSLAENQGPNWAEDLYNISTTALKKLRVIEGDTRTGWDFYGLSRTLITYFGDVTQNGWSKYTSIKSELRSRDARYMLIILLISWKNSRSYIGSSTRSSYFVMTRRCSPLVQARQA